MNDNNRSWNVNNTTTPIDVAPTADIASTIIASTASIAITGQNSDNTRGICRNEDKTNS